jgi:ABC-2 type transport system permease protein
MSELITLIKTNFLIGLNSFRTQNNSQKIGSSAVTVILGALGIFLSVYGNITLYNLYKEAPVPMFALIVMCVALLLIMFTSFMKVKGTLFGSKDYEMLKALPIKKSSILTAKLVDIYFSEFKFSLLALLPTLIIICMY